MSNLLIKTIGELANYMSDGLEYLIYWRSDNLHTLPLAFNIIKYGNQIHIVHQCFCDALVNKVIEQNLFAVPGSIYFIEMIDADKMTQKYARKVNDKWFSEKYKMKIDRTVMTC